jgi:transglutaminase-like putative cysteine protease
MPILYKIITAVLALTGCVSLLITGEMNLLVCIGGLSIFAGYYRLFRDGAQASKRVAAILAQAALFVFIADAFVITGDVFLAVAHMTITFQGIKSFDLKEPWDHLQVYFMSLLQLIIASELTRALTFGVIFVIFMVLLVTAMVLSHFLKEGTLGRFRIRRPVIAIVMLTMVCTVVFFMALPRTPQRFIGKSHVRGIKTVGFSDKLDFGSFGDIKLDQTVVMRIEMDREVSPPYYWRGIVMDSFDGISWRNTIGLKSRIVKTENEFLISPYDQTRVIEQRVYLEPIDSNVIFGLATMVAANVDTFNLIVDKAMGVTMPGRLSRRIKYSVRSDITSPLQGRSEERYLQVPSGMERIITLAKNISRVGSSDAQKASALEMYLKRNYIYSLSTSPPPVGMSAIENFLFNTKTGFCEHYASSMVIMLRGLGIPSRIVNGFYGGEKNEYGNYLIVRQSDAHAWVEALIEGQWERFDPTPAVILQKPPAVSLFLDSLRLQWTRYVVGFSADDQQEIVRTLASPFTMKGFPRLRMPAFRTAVLWFLLLAFVSLLLYSVLRKLRLRRYGFVTRAYLEFRDLLKKKGMKVTDAMTAGDLLTASRNSGFGIEAEEFLHLYQEHRFGGKQMDATLRSRYKELLKALVKSKAY